MNETQPPARRRKQLVAVAIILFLTILLYPQLKDFGAEIVRAFN